MIAYTIDVELFGTPPVETSGFAVTDPVPEAPSSCAGGQDDGNYTYSFKLTDGTH